MHPTLVEWSWSSEPPVDEPALLNAAPLFLKGYITPQKHACMMVGVILKAATAGAAAQFLLAIQIGPTSDAEQQSADSNTSGSQQEANQA